jgi:hypothetical protein
MSNSKGIRWAGYVSCVGEKRNVCNILMATLEEKRPLAIPRHMLKDNVKMDLREIGWGGMD